MLFINRVAHELFRIIGANGEIGSIKSVKNRAIWSWFEGQKAKDQGELWS